MKKLFRIDGRRVGCMLGRRVALMVPVCCALYPSASFAASSDSLFTGIMFAKNEVENATGVERDGVINLCIEAVRSAPTSGFWSDLEKDCLQFVELSLTETFGNSVSTSCLGSLSIPTILETSSAKYRDYTLDETSTSIGQILALSAVAVAEQSQSTLNCIDAMKAISNETGDGS